jgi:Na+/melibiose symporter-like transporter
VNLKLKAGLEVAGMVIVATVVIVGIRYTLDSIADQIGTENTLKGIMIASMVGVAYFLLGMLYDIRLAKLKYNQKLKEMVDQK